VLAVFFLCLLEVDWPGLPFPLPWLTLIMASWLMSANWDDSSSSSVASSSYILSDSLRSLPAVVFLAAESKLYGVTIWAALYDLVNAALTYQKSQLNTKMM